MNKIGLALSGHVKVYIDGALVLEKNNLVMDRSIEMMLDSLDPGVDGLPNSVLPVVKMGIGGWETVDPGPITPPTATDAALEREGTDYTVYIGIPGSGATATVDYPSRSIVYTVNFPALGAGNGDKTIQEAGLFYDTDDKLFSRIVFNDIFKGEANDLTITWAISFGNI